MEHLERVLAAHALSVGVEIQRGQGVEGFEASNDEVTVRAGEQRFRARWLVGCDGGRSTVRKQGGFEFVGTEPEFTGYSVQVEIADPEILRLGRHYTPTGMYTQWQPGVIAMVDFDGGAFHRTQPITCEHVQAVLRRVSCTDVTLKALNVASTWTDRSQQATTYRKGRVLLAGDAAHIHSPLGGQGLNLGLGDAMNLGWKLAATLRGDAPDGLLDSYTTERHPVGARILDWTRAQVALMRPNRHSRALEAILRDLIDTRDGATYFAERVWGVSLRYDLGEEHPLVGRSCPDFELEDGTRLGTLLRDGNGLLLDFGRQASLQALDGLWGDHVRYVASDAKDRLGLSALLVRPDGFVAWASDTTPNPEEVTRAAARWFASPSNREGVTSRETIWYSAMSCGRTLALSNFASGTSSPAGAGASCQGIGDRQELAAHPVCSSLLRTVGPMSRSAAQRSISDCRRSSLRVGSAPAMTLPAQIGSQNRERFQ